MKSYAGLVYLAGILFVFGLIAGCSEEAKPRNLAHGLVELNIVISEFAAIEDELNNSESLVNRLPLSVAEREKVAIESAKLIEFYHRTKSDLESAKESADHILITVESIVSARNAIRESYSVIRSIVIAHKLTIEERFVLIQFAYRLTRLDERIDGLINASAKGQNVNTTRIAIEVLKLAVAVAKIAI